MQRARDRAILAVPAKRLRRGKGQVARFAAEEHSSKRWRGVLRRAYERAHDLLSVIASRPCSLATIRRLREKLFAGAVALLRPRRGVITSR